MGFGSSSFWIRAACWFLALGLWRWVFGFGLFFRVGLFALGFWRWAFDVGLLAFGLSRSAFGVFLVSLDFPRWDFGVWVFGACPLALMLSCLGLLSLVLFLLHWTAA